MKVVVISDTHGNIARLKHVLGFAKEVKAKAVIHCGDWDNLESVKIALSYGIPLYSVLGNADVNPKIEQLLSSKCKKFAQMFLKITLGGKKIGISHYKNELTKGIKDNHFDIGFFGHTHQKEKMFYNGIEMINPGAIFRTNSPSFVVYDTDNNKVEVINLEDK